MSLYQILVSGNQKHVRYHVKHPKNLIFTMPKKKSATECEVYLEFTVLPWEDNEFGLVGLEALNISLETLQRTVLPAVVHCYTNCWCQLLGDSSSLHCQFYVMKNQNLHAIHKKKLLLSRQ
jgi:hypothetical protein